jgi:ActR/RegA family two-component response regulator
MRGNQQPVYLSHQRGPQKRTVLVVDDDLTIRSTLAAALHEWGYESREAATLREALAIVSRHRPAAVLLDLKLPDGSGIGVLEALKKRSPETVVIIITGYVNPRSAFEAGLRQAHGFLTKPLDETEVRAMLEEALGSHAAQRGKEDGGRTHGPTPSARENRRGRPQRQTNAPIGQLIVKAMKLLDLNYKDIVSESERLANLHHNADMRIGKSTLGNIISGSIRQPGTAKLDALRIILNLSRAETDEALGLQPERRFAEQLVLSRARTHLDESQLLEASVKRWTTIEVEYLSSFFPPHYCYVVVGEEDTNASPLAPPGSRVLVNKLANRIRAAENLSFHERELYFVMTPHSFTCAYLEIAPGDKVVLIPHPLSRNVREEFRRSEIKVIGQVVGVLYPR